MNASITIILGLSLFLGSFCAVPVMQAESVSAAGASMEAIGESTVSSATTQGCETDHCLIHASDVAQASTLAMPPDCDAWHPVSSDRVTFFPIAVDDVLRAPAVPHVTHTHTIVLRQ